MMTYTSVSLLVKLCDLFQYNRLPTIAEIKIDRERQAAMDDDAISKMMLIERSRSRLILISAIVGRRLYWNKSHNFTSRLTDVYVIVSCVNWDNVVIPTPSLMGISSLAKPAGPIFSLIGFLSPAASTFPNFLFDDILSY